MKEGEASFNKEDQEKEGLEKTKTFSNFGLSNMEAMRLLRDFGLLGKGAKGRLEGKERTYRNIAEHCLVVGMTTDVILQRLEELGLLTPEEREMGTKAAIIHDLTKRQELEVGHGIEADSPKRFLDPDKKKDFINNLLADNQVLQRSREILSLSDLTDDGILNFPENEKLNISDSPENLIRFSILFCDATVAHTDLVTPDERMKEIIERGGYNDLDVWWYRKLYGEEKLKGIEDPKIISEAVYSRKIIFLRQIEEQLKSLMGIDESESLSDYIKEEIKKRYESDSDKK